MANNLFSKPEINALKKSIVGDVNSYAEQIQQNSKDISSLKSDLSEIKSSLYSYSSNTVSISGNNDVFNGIFCLLFKKDVRLVSWKPEFNVSSGAFEWAYILFDSDATAAGVTGTMGDKHTAEIGDTIDFSSVDFNKKLGIAIITHYDNKIKFTTNDRIDGLCIGRFDTPSLTQYFNELVFGGEYKFETLEDVYVKKTEIESMSPNYMNGKVLSVTGDSEAYGHNIGTSNNYGSLISKRNNMTLHQYAINGRKLCSGTSTSLVDTYTEIASDSNYIIVHIGYNDSFDSSVANDSEDTSTYKGAFNVLINGLQTNYPNARILVITPYYYDNAQESIDKAEWMKQRCKYFKIKCFDGCENGGIRKGVSAMDDYFIDYVHLTVKGHERMSYLYEAQLRMM